MSARPRNIWLLRGGGIILKICINPFTTRFEPVMLSSDSVLRARLARNTKVLETLAVELTLFLVTNMGFIGSLVTVLLAAEYGLQGI